jgi:DNA-binding transcriptional LysR family regulator
MYLHLISLKIFSTIIEERSFSKAAEKLFITQPAVSLQVNSLENFFGIRLIHRKKGIRLTEGGKVLYEYAKKIEAIYEDLIKEVSRYEIKDKKTLSIGASIIPGKYFLPHIVCMFGKLRPEITIKLEIDNNKSIIEKLKDMKIAPANFPKDEISLKEFYNETKMVMREEDSGVATCFKHFCLNRGYDIKKFQISAILNCNESVKFAVKEGRGLGIVLGCSILSECKEGSIRIVKLKEGELSDYCYLAYRKEKLGIPVVQEFYGFLKQIDMSYLQKTQ